VDGETAVADEDVAAGQPAAELLRPLAGPVGQLLVPAAALAIGALRRREKGQHRQSLHDARPRDRRRGNQWDGDGAYNQHSSTTCIERLVTVT